MASRDRTIPEFQLRQSGPLRHELRRAGLCALLLPLVLLSMLAAGTMPVRAATGQVELVICVGDALVTVTVPADQAPPGEAPVEHRSCPWDEAARPALTVAETALIAAPTCLSPVIFTSDAKRIDVQRRSGPIANRGPPARI